MSTSSPSSPPHVEPTLEERIDATRRPQQPAIGVQKWRHLLFMHWQVPVAHLQALVPPRLTIDTFEGHAYVGVIPFAVRGARPRFLPPVSAISNFLEVNVRTYVHLDGREPGVWFFSLDATSTAAVMAARAGWRLPYFPSTARLRHERDATHYTSARRPPDRVPAELDVRYTVGEPLGAASPSSFEHFLVERYRLYTVWGNAVLKVGPVDHLPYPLQRAEVLSVSCKTLLESVGIPEPEGEPHVLFSPGVDVDIFPIRDPRR